MIIGAAVVLGTLCASSGSPQAYAATGPAAAAETSFSVTGQLRDVVAISSTDAWAVGWTGTGNSVTLIVHWNGHKWSPVTNPKPMAGALLGLDKVSSTDIWAAGFAGTFYETDVPLLMHWNGRAWSRVAGVPSVKGTLNAIGAAGDTLLAAGGLDTPPMLLMERTGTGWHELAVPSAPGELESLVVTGARSAWVAGDIFSASSAPVGDVLLRWNGSTWHIVSFPLHGTNENVWQLAAGPGGAVWAVGDSHDNAQTTFTPLSMAWNGTSWRKVAVPAPANSELGGVTFVPGGTAWAVGAWAAGESFGGSYTLILRWTGKAWSQVASPTPYTDTVLDAVAATSPRDAWAVGSAYVQGWWKGYILHWNGSTWQ